MVSRVALVVALCLGGLALSVLFASPGSAPPHSGMKAAADLGSVGTPGIGSGEGEPQVQASRVPSDDHREPEAAALFDAQPPGDVLDRLIETAAHDEIESALEDLVALPVERAREIRDLRAFARRLAEISLEHEAPPRPDAHIHDIEFAKSEMGMDSTRDLFLAHEGQIFALFGTGDYAGSHVVVRWTSEDTGKSLTRAVEIDFEDEWHSVYLFPKRRDWYLGRYRVDVFSADDDLALLASGNYRVAEDFSPPGL